jgi:hypothetical protein
MRLDLARNNATPHCTADATCAIKHRRQIEQRAVAAVVDEDNLVERPQITEQLQSVTPASEVVSDVRSREEVVDWCTVGTLLCARRDEGKSFTMRPVGLKSAHHPRINRSIAIKVGEDDRSAYQACDPASTVES